MSIFLRKTLKRIVVFVSLFWCASLYASGPQVSFGGYHFSVQKNPIFIGAAASDSLLLIFDKESKVSFVFNSYEQFAPADIPLAEFLEVVYGNKAPITELTKNLKAEVDKGRVSSKVSRQADLIIYKILYENKEKIIIANEDRMDSWIEIESRNIDISTLLADIKVI